MQYSPCILESLLLPGAVVHGIAHPGRLSNPPGPGSWRAGAGCRRAGKDRRAAYHGRRVRADGFGYTAWRALSYVYMRPQTGSSINIRSHNNSFSEVPLKQSKPPNVGTIFQKCFQQANSAPVRVSARLLAFIQKLG